ncbi:MAG: hypothetical protein E7277_00090 [Lachnospiraceae bacterium]|jgi:hypothetical protein|nr:hypothetical protein [Lachnospiraceae bacterium]
MKKRVVLMMALLLMVMVGVHTLEAKAATKPQVIISSYTLDDEIEFGKETNLHLNITNESGRVGVKGILITYVSENNTIVPAQGKSNQVYITSIEPGKTAAVDVPVVFNNSGDFFGQASFTIEYSVENREPFTNQSYIVFPFTESGVLDIKNVNVATNASIGAKSLVGVNYTNNSESLIRGVKLVVSGDVEGERVETKLGDVTAQRNGYFETYVVYKHEGANKIKISLVYEDEKENSYVANGGEYTVMVSKDNDVVDEGRGSGVTDNGQSENNSNVDMHKFFIGLAIILVVVLVVVAIVQVVRKRKM